MNTSARHYEEFPWCMGNCSARCTDEHFETCYNLTQAAMAMSVAPWVNETENCMEHIITTCNFHCLYMTGPENANMTVNRTLFPAELMPLELLTLDVTVGGGANGYACEIVMCPEPHLDCNLTVAKVGETAVYDPVSGNTTYIPILWNVTADSYLGCKRNRSETCLDTCHDVGHRICFPGVDPFDTCVQACVANKTYEPALPEFNYHVPVCTKALRLTPSEQDKMRRVASEEAARAGGVRHELHV